MRLHGVKPANKCMRLWVKDVVRVLPDHHPRRQGRVGLARFRRLGQDRQYLALPGASCILPRTSGISDSLFEGYSMRFTPSLILTGGVVGALNVYLLMRE